MSINPKQLTDICSVHGLTEKQTQFVVAYMGNGRNASAAYRTAYNVRRNGSANVVTVESSKLLRHPKIRAVLDEFGIPLAAARASAPGGNRAQERQEPNAAAKQSDAAPSEPTFKKLNPFTGKEDGIAAGKILYNQIGCQGCHGGGGGGGMAASLIDDSWKFGSDDETLYKLIKGQIPEQTMPVVYSSLPDEQVWQILAYIRTLYKGDPSKINW